MLKKAKNLIRKFWNANKTLFVFVSFAILFNVALLVITTFDYMQLRKVSGVIAELKEESYKKDLYVKIKLLSDTNVYYQVYTKRFFDDNLPDCRQNESTTFYTTIRKFTKHKAILSDDTTSSFDYYPILGINEHKSFFQTLLSGFYRNSLFTILFDISMIGTFFYLIPFIATTNWKKRAILLCICTVYLWLYF